MRSTEFDGWKARIRALLNTLLKPVLLSVFGWASVFFCASAWASTTPVAGAASAQGETESYEVTPPDSGNHALPWLNQNISLIGGKDISYGPRPRDDIYLEYAYYGRKGPLELSGYIDAPKILGVGNSNASGVWDKGSPLFMEHQPRLSIDELLGRKLGFGLFKEFYIAFDWIYDLGHNKAGRANTLYSGFGTDIDTHSPLNLSANLYVKRQWENYGAPNENAWDGYRAQLKYVLPLGHFDNGGSLTYVGFTNFDFGSDLHDQAGPARTANATVATNILVYSLSSLRLMAVGRYFHNGGNWKDGSELDFGDGPFEARSNGWGYYFGVGYQF